MIRLIALDVDGVLTSGQLYYGADGEILKVFHAHDGLALSLLQKSGVEVAVISGRGGPALDMRLDGLGIKHRFYGCRDKRAALQSLLTELEMSADDCLFVGDDLLDLGAMEFAGHSACPAGAAKDVRRAADYISPMDGGVGAVRDICEHFLAQDGISLLELYEQHAERDSKQPADAGDISQ